MSLSIADFPCDVCGAPSTSAGRDAFEVTGPDDTIQKYRPGELKVGCDLHPPNVAVYDLNGEIEEPFDFDAEPFDA